MNAYKALLLAGLGLAIVGATNVKAADVYDSLKDSPDYGYSVHHDSGWMIRGRVLGVLPDAGASNFNIAGDNDVDIDDSIVPELDITYFFNKHFALELILAVTPHEVSGERDLAGLDIGEAWLLPPTLLAQYHFDLGNGIKPYVGAGINYTVFFSEDAGDLGSLDLDNNFGWALQAGVDIHLRDNWYFNVDVKKLWLETDATIGGAVTADVDIDPWIIGVGLGYRFGGTLSPLK